MTSWVALEEELAHWRDAGRAPTLWWRDDDVVDATPALDRLLALQRRYGVPLALAVVPAGATPALARRLAGVSGIDLLQHGYAHSNHAAAGEKSTELGAERPAMMVLGELGTGWLALERLFGPAVLPVLVPPWNRIAPGLVPALPEIGYRGLSAFGARLKPRRSSGWVQVNAHVDLIKWRERRFAGPESLLGAFVSALAAARVAPEPLGLLSHHLAMDEPAWDFLDLFWERVGRMPGVRIAAARCLFAPQEARA
jgi:hypothetical protein